MPLTPVYTLVVDLASITGQDTPGVAISVEMASPRLIYPVGGKVIVPEPVTQKTDAAGVARFQLLATKALGSNYRLRVGTFDREFSMPAKEVSFGEVASSGLRGR